MARNGLAGHGSVFEAQAENSIATRRPCGHMCELNQDTCCVGMDIRPVTKRRHLPRHELYCGTCRQRLAENATFCCHAHRELPLFDDEEFSTDDEVSLDDSSGKSDSTFEMIDQDDTGPDFVQLPTMPEKSSLGDFVVLAVAPAFRLISEDISP